MGAPEGIAKWVQETPESAAVGCEVQADQLVSGSNRLDTMPGAGPMQIAMIQAAATFRLAAAVNRLADATVRAAHITKIPS